MFNQTWKMLAHCLESIFIDQGLSKGEGGETEFYNISVTADHEYFFVHDDRGIRASIPRYHTDESVILKDYAAFTECELDIYDISNSDWFAKASLTALGG